MIDTKAIFQFKQFSVQQQQCAMKVNTDGILLGAWAEGSQTERILDVGTGSGVIALMLAQRLAAAHIDAVEIEVAAAEEARANAAAAPWPDRVVVHTASIQEYARNTAQRYDLIVSNPPFFTGGVHNAEADRTAARHTIKLSHGDLLRAVQLLLKPGGRFAVILPLLEGLRFAEMAQQYKLFPRRQLEVRPRDDKPVNRLLIEFGTQKGAVASEELILFSDEEGTRTKAYAALVADFYLKV
jgi:tRNA1Val (adenine37-N6)-methyltransferase